ncbi:MAG: site-specific integrase [Clostridiales bacterium]|jgi:integrase|nr:site-specific integrase [Clostridiales bacterium]
MEKKIKVYDMFSIDELLAELDNQDGSISNPEKERINMLLEIKGVSVDSKPRVDGRWQGRALIDNAYKSVYGKSKEEVIFKLQKLLNEREKPNTKKKSTSEYKLHAWLDKWYSLYKEAKIKPKTQEVLNYNIARLKKEFPDAPLKALKGLDIQEKLLSIQQTRTREILYQTLNAALNKAEKLKLIKDNPCAAVEIPKHQYKHRNALTIDEQMQFLEAIAGDKYELFFVFLLFTGLRVGEALALSYDDFHDGYVTVNKNVVDIKGVQILQTTPKTDASVRKVPVPPQVYEKIATRSGSDRVFDFTQNAVKLKIKRIFATLKIEGSLHTLRHTYATRLEEHGVPSVLTQRLMGHADIKITQKIYTDTQIDYINAQKGNIFSAFDTDLTQKTYDTSDKDDKK